MIKTDFRRWNLTLREWREAHGFIYIFGKADGDDECPAFASLPIKIGITKTPDTRLPALCSEFCETGTWLAICHMETSSKLLEKALHEILNPWRCPMQREFFTLPDEVEMWLYAGFKDSWINVQKYVARRGDEASVLDLCLYEMLFLYPAGDVGRSWLDDRTLQMRKSIGR